MKKVFMSRPKSGEIIGSDWIHLDGMSPLDTEIGLVCKDVINWFRPDPDYDYPELDEMIGPDWLFISSNGKCHSVSNFTTQRDFVIGKNFNVAYRYSLVRPKFPFKGNIIPNWKMPGSIYNTVN